MVGVEWWGGGGGGGNEDRLDSSAVVGRCQIFIYLFIFGSCYSLFEPDGKTGYREVYVREGSKTCARARKEGVVVW